MSRSGRLARTEYEVDAATLARRLLGCVLVAPGTNGSLRARIVETEAYLGEHDLACHAAKGRTKRTESLYGPPGTAYVYLIYGMYHLFNVVAAAPDDPQAVLVRAVEPLGFEARTHGPGLLTRALDISLRHDRTDLVSGPLGIEPGPPPARVVVGPRIGVDYAGTWAAAPLRFGDADSERLSRRFRPTDGRPAGPCRARGAAGAGGTRGWSEEDPSCD